MLINYLANIWENETKPFYLDENKSLFYQDIENIKVQGLENLTKGDVVALIGDFDPESISTFLKLIELGCIIVPLTDETLKQHEYFLKESKTQFIFRRNKLEKIINNNQISHPLLDKLRNLLNYLLLHSQFQQLLLGLLHANLKQNR